MDARIIGTVLMCVLMAICAVFFGYRSSEKEEKGESMGCTGSCGSCSSHCKSAGEKRKSAAISAAAKIKEMEQNEK